MTTSLSSFLSSTYIGKRGFGLFNAEIDNRATYTCSTVKGTAITFPASEDKYLVRSILLTNISESNNASITGEVYFSNTNTAVVIANGLPMNVGSTLELIKKPKVFSANDEIRLTSNANSTVSAYITYQTDTSLNYFGNGVTLTSSANTDVFVASAGDSVVESIHIANISSVDIDMELYIAHANSEPISYLAKTYIIPTNAAIELNEQPKLLSTGQKIMAKAPASNLVSVVISGIYR